MERTLYSGWVVSTKDPKGLGRVQVELKGFDESVELPWVRLLQPTSSKKFGHMFLPENGDEVIVMRGAGEDFDSMVILGSVYNGSNKPKNANQDGKNNIKEIVTRSGHEFTFVDEPGKESITLQTPSAKLRLNMDQPGLTITIESEDKIQINAKNEVSVSADQIKVDGKTKVAVTGGQQVTVEGQQVKVTGGAQVSISAPSVSIG